MTVSDLRRPAAPRPVDFRVGEWLAEPSLNRLSSDRADLRIRPQLMDVLVCLARHHGRVVLKDELLAQVWPDRIITESGMVRCIAELRQLLGDDSHEPRYIETIPKRGYRLVASVEWLPAAPPPDAAAPVVHPAAVPDDRIGDAEAAGPEVAGYPANEPREGGDAAAAPPREGSRTWLIGIVTLAVLAVAIVAGVSVLSGPSAPHLTDRDLVVLAFENATGDAVFNDTLPLAMAIQFEQSPFLRILPDEKVRHTLGLMQRPPDSPVTRALGTEICERAGAAALIAGSVTRLGRHFVIGIEATACATGDVLGRQQIEVGSPHEVLAALGRAASQIRRDLGESRASLAAYDVPVTEATTPSLEALRALRRGEGARERGRATEALRFYREAVGLDADFALAQVRLGSYALFLHHEAEGVAALQRAFALRERVTFPERLEIDLLYHANLTGDQDKVTEALETMRRTYPRKYVVRRRLAQHYLSIGRFDEALAEAQGAFALDATNAPVFAVLGQAYLVVGRFADARRTFEDAIGRGLDTDTNHANLLRIGFLTGDGDLIARERAWAATSTEGQPAVLEAEAEDAVWRGRLRDALAYLDRYQAFSRQRGAEYRWIVLELRKARFEALCGYSARAMARVERQLATDTLGPDLQIDALKVAVSAGDTARVARLLADLDAAGWPRVEQPYAGFVTSYRAALETDRGQPARALELLEPMVPFELGLGWGLIPLHERARAHQRAGQWGAARDAFRKMLRFPGVFSGQKLLPAAQLGLARALAAGGLMDESRDAYRQFLDLWRDADADLPVLADARRELARLR